MTIGFSKFILVSLSYNDEYSLIIHIKYMIQNFVKFEFKETNYQFFSIKYINIKRILLSIFLNFLLITPHSFYLLKLLFLKTIYEFQ